MLASYVYPGRSHVFNVNVGVAWVRGYLHSIYSNVHNNYNYYGRASLILFLPGMRLKDTKHQSYNNMVHNPIYAGLNSPVYDSIWTRALEESLGTDGNKVPFTADRQFNATSKKCSHSMSTEYAPNKVQHDESLHW